MIQISFFHALVDFFLPTRIIKLVMRKLLTAFTFLCLLAAMPCNSLAVEPEQETVLVIPIEGMIERGLLYVVRRSLAKAQQEDIKTIVFHMDTPGGRVDVTESIVKMLVELPPDMKTYTFVDQDALSGGSMLAFGTDEIYMAPMSRIGASAIITSTGDIKNPTVEEKSVSSMLATITEAARHNGHDPELVACMVRMEHEYVIEKDVICKKGELLTLSTTEAERFVGKKKDKHRLLSKGTVGSLDELLAELGKPDAIVRTIEVTWSERLARWIEMLAVVFLAAGLLGVYIEIKTPGFGLPGIAGILCLAMFFWGHNVAGLAGAQELLLLLLGFALLAVEIFLIPGFGFVGIAGIILIVLAMLFSMVEHLPGLPVYKLPPQQLETAIIKMALTLIVSFILMVVLTRYFPNTSVFRHLELAAAMSSADGYQASRSHLELVGKTGRACTNLHPSGAGDFDDKRLSVVARGEFINKDEPIVIAETHGSRIVVERMQNNSS